MIPVQCEYFALEGLGKILNTIKIIQQRLNEELEIEGVGIYDQLNEKDILKFIQGLPQGFRMIFNLFAVEGYSHKEIAEKLDISEGTSKSQYARARKALQKMIKEEQEAAAVSA